jgi:hypothetical protein
MRLIEWRPLVKGSLRGFVTVELPNGLVIRDISVLSGANGSWANLPAKPQVDRDGHPRISANGRPLYVKIIEWRDRQLNDRFSTALIGLIKAEYPDAFDRSAP